MVKNSRTPARLDAIRSLNAPRPITVESQLNPRGISRPMTVIDGIHRTNVARIEDFWRIDDEWWFRPIARHYYRVAFTDGRSRTIYHDLFTDIWHMQTY